MVVVGSPSGFIACIEVGSCVGWCTRHGFFPVKHILMPIVQPLVTPHCKWHRGIIRLALVALCRGEQIDGIDDYFSLLTAGHHLIELEISPEEEPSRAAPAPLFQLFCSIISLVSSKTSILTTGSVNSSDFWECLLDTSDPIEQLKRFSLTGTEVLLNSLWVLGGTLSSHFS